MAAGQELESERVALSIVVSHVFGQKQKGMLLSSMTEVRQINAAKYRRRSHCIVRVIAFCSVIHRPTIVHIVRHAAQRF